MKSKFTQNWMLPPAWLRFLIIALLVLGVFFRFANLDQKVYWHDETFTSLHLAGHTGEDLKQQIYTGKVIGVEDLLKYQYPQPDTSLMDTINALIVEDPQHPPIYYMIARLWMKLFGNSIAVVRSVSAVISLLVFPCIYWLCLELFESSLVGWVAIALSAVSPVQVVFAQEAREYSLLMVITLLSSASLLQAIRLKTKLSWLVYAVTLALGLYSLPLILLTAIGHGIYVMATSSKRWSKTIGSYLLATATGILAFIPWVMLTFNRLSKAQDTTKWSSTKVPFSRLVKSWAGNTSRVFFDINLDANAPVALAIPPILILVILVSYSFYFLCRKTPQRVYLFLITMIGVPALAFILPDLISGGLRSTVPRYLVPCFLAILLAVAYLLGSQIISPNSFRRKLWQVIMACLLSAEVISCAFYTQSTIWWNKKPSNSHIQAASLINQTDRPLIITSYYEANLGELTSLSYLLDQKVKLQLLSEPDIPKIPNGFGNIFVFSPSPNLKAGIEKEYKSKLVAIEPSELQLWQLNK